MAALSAGVLLSCLTTQAAAEERRKVLAYVPNWIDLKTYSESIPYEKLTHINIAFENPVNDQGEISFNPENAVLIKKAHEHGVKVCISIGGGSASGNKVLKARYFDLLGAANRDRFAATLADYVSKHEFDGLDVDIEGPSINQDYGSFIESLAAVLKPRGKLLTAALSQGYGGDKVPDSVFAKMDFVNIMAYDGAGYWAPDSPGQHSSFELAKDSVAYWLKRGLPKSKAVLGVPFYGYGFGEAFKKRDYPYATILAAFPEAHSVDQVGKTIWYNGIPTIKTKTKYAMEEGLAGVMIWSLDADVPGKLSLLNAIHETLHTARNAKLPEQ